ncbi:MAG: hypothetical protein IPL86_15875 [Flavobacteriales bacterium]|nr:hypothetical protein [Flavobacteriales bacterium]
MQVSDIISRVERTLFDITNVRWPEAELIDYINDAQQAVILARPDANSKNVTMPLAVGTRQTIPSDAGRVGIRFLRLTRNVAGDLRAIRESSRVALDNELPNWHTANPSTSIQHYVFDNVDPKIFYVYPPAASGAQVEIIYSALPAKATAVGDTLTLSDNYLNAVYDWVLYRCYSKDASYAGNLQRAQYHANAFAAQLGINMQTEFMAASGQQATPTPAAAPQVRTGG